MRARQQKEIRELRALLEKQQEEIQELQTKQAPSAQAPSAQAPPTQALLALPSLLTKARGSYGNKAYINLRNLKPIKSALLRSLRVKRSLDIY